MADFDAASLRTTISQLATDHDASGEQRPEVGEVFAPVQHAAALAPTTLIVVGARGAGKSFWAGVLERPDTRALAAEVYPNLGLDRLVVRFGYTGFGEGSAVSRRVVEARVPPEDHDAAVIFWQTVILRAGWSAIGDPRGDAPILTLLKEYADPEVFEIELRDVDEALQRKDKVALVIFDALDTLSREWRRLTELTDALFEAVWLLRARKNLKAKIFIRPDQLNDEGLRFVELPKLRGGRVELNWSRRDLYGLLFSRIIEAEQANGSVDFRELATDEGAPPPASNAARLRRWPLARVEERQKRVMERLAGLYMGASSTKGATYPWTFNHLADGKGVVTPRSFLKLFVEAANSHASSSPLVLPPESLRHGLREASKIRVEQLALEYRWIKRALAPLAGLKVPCQRYEIHEIWEWSGTVKTIEVAAAQENFLPPYRGSPDRTPEEGLELAMERIGVISYRPDGRVDIPDLFRIAARMFKLGGVALNSRP